MPILTYGAKHVHRLKLEFKASALEDNLTDNRIKLCEHVLKINEERSPK
jgi:hypothetical protein